MLVSQIQRSGGTLLSRLFDGHPECHAHPQELEIGHPKKKHWPPIDLGRPDSWFDILHEKHAGKYRSRGYLERTRRGRLAFPLPFLPADPARDLRVVHRRPETTERARRARLLLHLLLQRVARRPQPLLRPEEGRHRLRPAAKPGSRQRRSLLRDLPGRDAGLHRPGSPRLVCLGPAAPGPYEDVERAVGLWRQSAASTLEAHDRQPDASWSSSTRNSSATRRR